MSFSDFLSDENKKKIESAYAERAKKAISNVQQTPSRGVLGEFGAGLASNALGTIAGQMDAGRIIANTDGSWTKGVKEYAEQFNPSIEYTWQDRIPFYNDVPYYTDARGIARDLGGALGSMGVLTAESFAPVPFGGTMAKLAGGAGSKVLSKSAMQALEKEAIKQGIAQNAQRLAGELIMREAKAKPLEMLSNAGSAGAEVEGEGIDRQREVMAKAFLAEIPGAIADVGLGTRSALQALQGVGTNRVLGVLGSGASNAFEEGYQTQTPRYAKDEISFSKIYNPLQWDEEAWNSASLGAITGLAPAIGGAGIGYMADKSAKTPVKEQQKESKGEEQDNQQVEQAETQTKQIADAQTADYEAIANSGKTQEQISQELFDKAMRDLYGVEPKKSAYPKYGRVEQRKAKQPPIGDVEKLPPAQLNVSQQTRDYARQQEAQKQRQQTSSVTHDADNLLLQASMEQPKMQKPQRGLSIVNRGEVGNVNQQQKEYAEPPTTEGKYLRNYEQELVNKYIGNPQLFEKDYFSAQNAVKRAFKNGDLTKEEAETNLNNLRGLYDRTAQAIRNNGVIRQTGIKKPRNIKNIISEARQKQKNEMGKIAKAVNDVKLRNRLESGVKTQIQVPYYIQNAVKEVQEIKKAKADEQRKQQVFDEMKQGATEYINSIEPEAKQEVINASLEEAKASRKELFTPLVNQLKEGMGQGVTRQYTDKETGEVVDVSDLKGKEETKNNSASYNREVYSNNAPWYQNWFKSNGRKPNNAELYEIAENIYLGNDEYGSHLLEGIENDEEALSQNKANVEYFDNLIKIYEEMGAQTTTKQEEATTETPSKTAQEAPEQEQKAEPKEVVEAEEKEPVNEDVASDVEKKAETKNVAPKATNETTLTQVGEKNKPTKSETTDKTEVKADVDDLKYLSKEGKEVFQKVVDVLKTGNDKVAQSAEMGALIYARRADNYAEAMRKAGNKDYTALNYLNDNPVQVGGVSDENALKHSAAMRRENKTYVTNSDGNVDWGYIANIVDANGVEIKSAPLRVQIGYQVGVDTAGNGYTHIHNRHLPFLKAKGYESIEQATYDILENFSFIAVETINGETRYKFIKDLHPRTSIMLTLDLVKDDLTDEEFYTFNSFMPRSKSQVRTEKQKALVKPEERSPQDQSPATGAFRAFYRNKSGSVKGSFARNNTNAIDTISIADVEKYVKKFTYEDEPLTQISVDKDLVAYHNTRADHLKEALKSGGLAVPSMAIVKKEADYDKFGDITLVGTKDLVDPQQGTDVYSKDAYTARMPEKEYTKPKASAIKAFLAEWKDRIGDIASNDIAEMRYHLDDGKVVKAYERFFNNLGVKYYYLTSVLGKKIELPLESGKYKDDLLKHKDFIDGFKKINEKHQGMWHTEESRKEAGKYIKDHLDKRIKKATLQASKEMLEVLKDIYIEANGEGNVNLLRDMTMELKRVESAKGKVDIYALRNALNKDYSNELNNVQYKEWATSEFEKMAGKPVLKLGRKYVPYTLENIVEYFLKNKGSGKEKTWGFGDRKLASMSSKKFKDIADIKANKEMLQDEDTVDAQIEKSEAMLDEFRMELTDKSNLRYPRTDLWALFDEINEALSKIAGKDKPTRADLRRVLNNTGSFKYLDDDVLDMGLEAIATVKNTATQYFEAKPQRAVAISEFAGAVVPNGTDKALVEELEKQGLQVEYYDKDEKDSRKKAMQKIQQDKENVLFQSAWHGTPHKFDKFDLGNIGTGEGAQVHGWGLYFAKNKEIAQSYKDSLSQMFAVITVGKKVFRRTAQDNFVNEKGESVADYINFALRFLHNAGSLELANKRLTEYIKHIRKMPFDHYPEGQLEKSVKAKKWLARKDVTMNPSEGSLFEVDVPDDSVLLDEDKPLNEQPKEVRKAILEYYKSRPDDYIVPENADDLGVRNGKEFYDDVVFQMQREGKQDAKRSASELLNSLGIKGITYDGFTDGRCFVVFDDKAISVINRYNQMAQDETTVKGETSIIDTGKKVVKLFKSADESTFVHEIGHVAYADLQEQASMENAPQQIKDDLKTVDDWAEWKDGQLAEYEGTAVYNEFKKRDADIREAIKNGDTAKVDKLKYEWKQERFARGFEEYLRQGNAPSNALKKVFQKFKEWLTEIYQGYKAIGAVPSKEVQAVMDRMLLVKSETNKDNNIKFRPLDNPAYQRSLEEIYDDLNDIFEGAKVEELGNEEWRVTTPNGKRIIVKVADRIILNDKQSANMRKAHNLDSDYIAEASGYWRAIGENDVDGELVISRNSKKGTAYHEILHAVMDLALTTKEKQALIKDAMKEAKATGKDVEEVIAERYRKWVLARKKGQGTAFGKLFKKMQDFYYKLKKLFTGMENAHNIMRKIESGEVWTRDNRRVVGRKGKRFLVAYHGTPYDFDKFDSKKVGTGIGSQMHGWGLYFAENKDVAEDYRDRQIEGEGTGRVFEVDIPDNDVLLDENLNFNEQPAKVKEALTKIFNDNPEIARNDMFNDVKKYLKTIEKELEANDFYGDDVGDELKESFGNLLDAIVSGDKKAIETAKSAFETDINVQLSMQDLDFDLDGDDINFTVSDNDRSDEISKLASKLAKEATEYLTKEVEKKQPMVVLEAMDGDGIYNILSSYLASQKKASKLLDENGIKGIQFGDKTNRAYVVFDDSQVKTLRKYSEAPTKNNLNSIVVSTETSSLSKTIKEQGIKGWLQDKAKNFYRDWVDKNDALHDYDNAIEKATGRKLTDGEKIYNKAQMMNATATGMTNALIEGDEQHIKSLSKRLGRELHNVTLKKILDFINNDKMNKLFPNYLKENGYKDWVDAFGHYLAFRRLREMVKYKRELFNEEHAKWVEGGKKGKEPVFEPYKLPEGVTIQDIEKAIQNAPAPFKKASEMYYDLNDNMLIILEDAGIISKEVHKLLNDKYKEYCPLMRDFSDTAGADMFLQGLSNGGRGIANVSSTLKRISLEGSERGVINPLETTFKAVAVMANRAERNKVGQLAVSYAKMQGMEDIIHHIPTPKGGNAVADPKNSIFTVMIDGKKEAYQVIPELYSPIVGYNVPTAGFVLGVARDTARMLRTGATISPSFVIRNFIRDTIFASISSQNGFIPIVDSVKGAYALLHDAELKADFEVAGVTAFNFYKNAETAYKSLVELNGGKEINFYNPIDVIKALAKYPEEFSAFVESATRMGEFKRAREAGKSIDEATRDARELTIDFSRSGVLGENVNLVVPFFNATIQGGDKLYRLFRDNPVGTAVNVAKYIVLPSMVLWAMNYDDEEYKELDPKIKMTHWIIGDVRIPKPQEAGVLFGSGIEAMLDLAMGNDPEAMKHWAKQVKDSAVPNILPTVILPIVEWQANYSFFRDGKLVGYREERLPDELQYKDSTSELSKDLGKLTGLSPIKLDNTVRGYTGTMGMLLWQAYDIGSMDKAKLPEKKITELPLIRDFFVNDYNARRSVDDFYKLAEQADKQHAGYGVKGKPNAVVQGIRRAKQQISNINKDIRNITASNLTPSEKRERIDKKREIMHRIAKQANNRYGKFFE